MQSEDRVATAAEAVANQVEMFRSALATTLEQVRSLLVSHRPSANGHVDRFRAELGRFAAGRINTERFAGLLAVDNGMTRPALDRIEQALGTLSALIGEKDSLFRVRVDEGGDLERTVADALGRLGTAFGAARVVSLSRSDCYRDPEHSALLESFGFESWNRAERLIAPPLIVEVCGNDFRPVGLGEFLDGSQRIVLVVSGECPPAPLARLVTPGVFVMQTVDGAGLDRMRAWSGPAIIALVPDSAARFVHDPSRGGGLSDRVQVGSVPERPSTKVLAGLSPAQQADQLAQLVAMDTAASGVPETAAQRVEGSGPADPADKLAAWLLSQGDLTV